MNTEVYSVAVDILDSVLAEYPRFFQVADDLRTITNGTLIGGSLFSTHHTTLLKHRLKMTGDDGGAYYENGFVGALAAWGANKAVYRFDDTLFDALLQSSTLDQIPTDAFLRLPSTALFIELQEHELFEFPIMGFWLYLSRLKGEEEIIISTVLDHPDIANSTTSFCHVSYAIPLARTTLDEALAGLFSHNAERWDETRKNHIRNLISKLLSLALYLCSDKPDVDGDEPKAPLFKYMGKKKRLSISKEPAVWNVGVRLGAALRMAGYQASTCGTNTQDGDTTRQVRPHMRRAHWHSYWVGKKGEQTISVRWLPPIPVNVDDPYDLPTVVRPVLES